MSLSKKQMSNTRNQNSPNKWNPKNHFNKWPAVNYFSTPHLNSQPTKQSLFPKSTYLRNTAWSQSKNQKVHRFSHTTEAITCGKASGPSVPQEVLIMWMNKKWMSKKRCSLLLSRESEGTFSVVREFSTFLFLLIFSADKVTSKD